MTKAAFAFSSTLLAIAILGATAYLLLADDTPTATVQILPPLPTDTPAPTATPAPVVVYITGAVDNPQDMMTLPQGSRVSDAIEAAGGSTDDANLDAINLAQILHDGDMIYVPSLTATEIAAPPNATNTLPTPNSTRQVDLININTASLEEFEDLPGIGPSKAQAIIDYRTNNGAFNAVDELLNVTGIGNATLETIRPLITVGP